MISVFRSCLLYVHLVSYRLASKMATITSDGIVKSPFADFDIPEVPLHVALFAKFAEHGDKVSLVGIGRLTNVAMCA